jgi:hypothetical protein
VLPFLLDGETAAWRLGRALLLPAASAGHEGEWKYDTDHAKYIQGEKNIQKLKLFVRELKIGIPVRARRVRRVYFVSLYRCGSFEPKMIRNSCTGTRGVQFFFESDVYLADGH